MSPRSLVYQRSNEKEDTEAWAVQSVTVAGNCQREKLGNSWTKSIRQGDTVGYELRNAGMTGRIHTL